MTEFKFTLYSPEDIQLWEDPEWLIEDILPAKSFSEIVGKWGSGKTFVALDWALSIATGTPWGGKHEVKQGGVLYVFGEGRPGIKQRVNAWFDHYGVNRENVPFRAVPLPVQLANMDDVNKFTEDVDAQLEGDLQLIIFDTLARSIVGVDEDRSVDMGVVVNSLDYLRRGYDASILTVHHTGHGNLKRGRGSSAVPAAIDMSILTEKKPDSRIVKLSCTKAKDADEFDPFSVTLEDSREKNPNGKPVTLVSVLGGRVPLEDPLTALSRNQNSQKLLEFMVNERPMGDSYKHLKEENIIATGSFHKAVAKLLELGLATRAGPIYYPTEEAMQLFVKKEFN